MAKYQWRGVVIEERHGIVSHYGQLNDLLANELSEAKAEVERVARANGANCLQILDEEGGVATYKLLLPELGKARWA